MSILDKIVLQKKKEIHALKNMKIDFVSTENESKPSFFSQLSKPGLNLIAEIKKASPSAGVIREDFDPVGLSLEFVKSGASALSVLTDEKFFLGHLDYLNDVRQHVSIPILRKEFILDTIQVKQSACHGASAILLILSILDYDQAQRLLDCAAKYNLDVLIEVHDESELECLLKLEGVKVIGFNNRNLNTFTVDINHSLKMKQQLSNTHLKDCLYVAESGYKNVKELDALKENNFNGVLIGEGLALDEKLGSYFKK